MVAASRDQSQIYQVEERPAATASCARLTQHAPPRTANITCWENAVPFVMSGSISASADAQHLPEGTLDGHTALFQQLADSSVKSTTMPTHYK
jgi:hypothetical protein